MIPMICRLKVRKTGGGVNLWLPLFLVWILLLPLGAICFAAWLILHALSHCRANERSGRVVRGYSRESEDNGRSHDLSSGAAVGAAGLAAAFQAIWHLKGLRVEIKNKTEEIVLYML